MAISAGVLICTPRRERFFAVGVGDGTGEGGANNWLSKFIGWVPKNLGHAGLDFLQSFHGNILGIPSKVIVRG